MANIIITNGNSGLLSETITCMPEVPYGVPVPNCEENIQWWLDYADEDPDEALSLLVKLEDLEIKWVKRMLTLICEECYV